MADTFPTLGLAFDLNEVAAGQASLDALKASYVEVGAAAESAAAQAGAANAALRAGAAQTESPLSGRAISSANAADLEKANLAQIVAETPAAVEQMNALMAEGA